MLEAGGYAAASVAAIAERAGVATGTLYRHFPSKADLFVELFRAIGDAELAAMHGRGRGDAQRRRGARRGDRDVRRPRAVAPAARVGARLRAARRRPSTPSASRYRRAYARRMARFVRERVERGELPDQDPDTTAAALIGGIVEALVSPLSPVAGGNADPDAVIAALTAFCRRAVGAATAPAAARRAERVAGAQPRSAAATASHTRRCSATFAVALGAHLDDRHAAAAERARPARARSAASVGDERVARAVERGRLREVEPVRRRDVLLEVLALARDRQEVEDPAAVVVDEHDRQRPARAAAPTAARPRS